MGRDEEIEELRQELAAVRAELKTLGRDVRPPRGARDRRCLRQRRPVVGESQFRAGIVAQRPTQVSFEDAHHKFIEDCRAGVALNNRGEPYKPNAIKSLDCALRRVPAPIRRKSLPDVSGGELQEAIDDYIREGLSSSRIHTIICAVRSLYTWAIHRGKVAASPAASLRLPAVSYEARDRIAKPGEFALLLAALKSQNALPWALAGYGTARRQEIRALSWPEVSLGEATISLAEDDRARKSDAAWRLVPMVTPLRRRITAEWARQGEPETGRVCPPRRRSKSGLLSLDQLSHHVATTWRCAGLEPIGLQDSRHTAATWLDHAGISPKVASVLMGHKNPSPVHHGYAPITQRRYTHVLDGELDRARDLLDDFIATREAEEADLHFRSGFVP